MANDTTAGADVTSALDGLGQVGGRFVDGLYGRISGLSGVPAEFQSLQASLAAAGTSAALLCFQIILIATLVACVFLLLVRWFNKTTAGRGGWRRLFAGIAAAALALALGFFAARLLGGSGPPMRILRLWAVMTIVGCVMHFAVRSLLMASGRSEFSRHANHLAALSRDLSIAIGLALVGTTLVATLQFLGAGSGLNDLVRTGVGIPTYLLFAGVVWWHKRTMAGAVAGPRPRSRWRSRLARLWPAILIGFIVITYLTTQATITLGATLPVGAVLFTALAILATPHLDAMIGHWAQRGLESPNISVFAAARRQTARFTVVVVVVALLGTLWVTPLAVGLGLDMRNVGRNAFGVALVALVGAFLWNVIGAVTARALRSEAPTMAADEDLPSEPRSRLGTLVPLLNAVGKSSILALALLSILVSVGVNVWPLITGLSVFGLAIAIGSQTLVKDVVSGLFFLIDDAFRFGEYIETSSAKGTVEKISIRSVSLRHHRGALATVPYGQIGEIQNFSRDWVVEKLTFRLALDTDVEKVRKLFKQIGQDIAADPELAGDLLEPFKSQGIAEVDDGTLIIRAKFKARPGKQYMIRRAALKAAHNAFRENGIKAVPKPLTANPDAAPAR